ncbi:hypothetical protein Ae201684P_004678 [Aphanomyces euteiches]|uniref:DDE-1 domain-containing protein n=1 Tax=Aphanomyces euteiches TaxID=100861 RepID=A0A6G0XC86_9STRA|nr:hypothetical protein Ae201684_006237 [Aphanomyces euteiches]KAH9068981.1 hypothetical protein Ae201684P_004678 [Aphanomyces euteiches]
MTYDGSRLTKKINNGKREIFPDPDGFVAFMTKMRNEEKALSCVHNINWIKKHHHPWLLDYLSTKSADTGYKSLLRLLQRFCDRYGFSRQRPVLSKQTQEVLESVHMEFAESFHREFAAYSADTVYNVDETGMYYDMPPRVIWSIRGGQAKIAVGEKHGYRMTAALTIRADGTKLPIMFVIRGQPGGRIEKHDLPTYPTGHAYAVQPKAWMDSRVWPMYLREVLGGVIAEPSVVLVDNFDAHVSEEDYRVVNEELGSHMCAIPPKATSVCQPLDVGIMAPFKKYLRRLWLEETFVEGDDDEDDEESPTSRVKRLVMIKRAIKAWDLITAEEVRASFAKAIPVQNS